MNDGDSSWGFSHLSAMPITLSFGVVLLGVLILLIILRVVFGSVGGSVTARGGVR